MPERRDTEVLFDVPTSTGMNASRRRTRLVHGDPTKHASFKHWSRLFPNSGSPSRIRILKPDRDFERCAVFALDELQGGKTVVAKRCPIEEQGVEFLLYSEILHQLPLVGAEFYGSTVDREAEVRWLFMEYVEGRKIRTTNPTDCALALRWLARLQAASLHYSDRLSGLPRVDANSYAAILRSVTDTLGTTISRMGLISDHRDVLKRTRAALDSLERHWDTVAAALSKYPDTLVHGDLSNKNLRVVRAGNETGVRAFDWEMAGWGNPSVDFASFSESDLTPFLQEARLRGWDVEVGAVRKTALTGRVLRQLMAMSWEMEAFAYSHHDRTVERIDVYHRELVSAGQRLGMRL